MTRLDGAKPILGCFRSDEVTVNALKADIDNPSYAGPADDVLPPGLTADKADMVFRMSILCEDQNNKKSNSASEISSALQTNQENDLQNNTNKKQKPQRNNSKNGKAELGGSYAYRRSNNIVNHDKTRWRKTYPWLFPFGRGDCECTQSRH